MRTTFWFCWWILSTTCNYNFACSISIEIILYVHIHNITMIVESNIIVSKFCSFTAHPVRFEILIFLLLYRIYRGNKKKFKESSCTYINNMDWIHKTYAEIYNTTFMFKCSAVFFFFARLINYCITFFFIFIFIIRNAEQHFSYVVRRIIHVLTIREMMCSNKFFFVLTQKLWLLISLRLYHYVQMLFWAPRIA